MFTKSKGVASIVVILLVLLGLVGGGALSYQFREPIKKYLTGKTTDEEIAEKVAEVALGKDKFELEGVVTSVDVPSRVITVKIKSSTNSIEELRLSETPITVSDLAKITIGDKKNPTISDIPINSKVHVGGTIKDGKLTATTVIVQKEDIAEAQGEVAKLSFEIGGVVKVVGTDNLTVTVKSASKRANSQKGKDLVVKITSSTLIKKAGVVIALSDIKAGDKVEVEGKIEGENYIASKIEVGVEEQGTELKETPSSSKSQGTKSEE